jgi:protease-4
MKNYCKNKTNNFRIIKFCIIGACLLMTKGMPLFSQNVFLELNMNNPAMQSMMHSVRPKPADLELFRVIERAGNDKKIGGIVLNISSYNAERTSLWGLRNALEKFKSKGKKVCVFISNADLDLYCLATVADKIVMDDLGILTMLGYSWGRGYFRHSLEKLGIGVRELRYLEFKSAAESFTRDSLSDADRRQYGAILDDFMALTRDTVINARSKTSGTLFTEKGYDNILNNEFMFSAKNAFTHGLVDQIGRKEAVIAAVKDITGMDKTAEFALYGDYDSSLTGSKREYAPGGSGFRRPIIAVINASGATDMEQGINAWALAKTIREISEKKRVKAIVLRISSPGGSAEAADYVAEAIKDAKERIPVVVSMGEVAASGGYWISMDASHISASPLTVTGSIGVIGTWFYDNGLNSKLGMTIDTMKRGDHADMTTGILLPRRDLTDEEEARYRIFLLDMYSDFTARVAASRGMDITRVESLAQGRVYSGIGALNAGLIDSIGGLDDAIRTARELAKIPDSRKVAYREFPKPKFFARMLNRVLSSGLNYGIAKNRRINGGGEAALFLTDLFLPAPLLEDLRYRIAHNGRIMPILPLDAAGWPNGRPLFAPASTRSEGTFSGF